MQGGPRIKQLDDLPWVEVARFGFADGRTASVNEKWLEHGPRFIAFWSKWDAGALSPHHGHTGDHSILILEGEIANGDQVCGPGSHIMLEWGDTFGPWVAGPDGCLMYGVVAGPANVFVDREGWKTFLAAHQAEELPVAALTFPLWYGTNNLLVNPTDD